MCNAFLDCKELPCPQPIIRIRKQLEESSPASLLVIVDNEPALENVCRFFASQGYTTSHTTEPGLWHITAIRNEDAPAPSAPTDSSPQRSRFFCGEGARTLVLVSSPVFGSGDDALGSRLMKNFLATLPEFGGDLWRLVLLNGGVRLSLEDSPVLEELRTLENNGVDVMVCGACLQFLNLVGKNVVGQTTNMLDVVTGMQLADKVIRM